MVCMHRSGSSWNASWLDTYVIRHRYTSSSHTYTDAYASCPRRQNPHPLKVPNVHLDILMGRDETVECADFMMQGAFSHCVVLTRIHYRPASDMTPPLNIHADMERKLRM